MGKSPGPCRSTIRQIALNNGYTPHFNGALNELTMAAVDNLVSLPLSEAVKAQTKSSETGPTSARRDRNGAGRAASALRAAVSPHRLSELCPYFFKSCRWAGEDFTFSPELGIRGLGGVLPTG
jgi:hypothetical protein